MKFHQERHFGFGFSLSRISLRVWIPGWVIVVWTKKLREGI